MWVIAVLVILAALFLFLICVPLEVVLHADVYEKPRFRVKFSWLFGLVSRDITGEKKQPEKKQKDKKGKEKRKRGDARLVFNLFRTKGVLRRVINLITGILRCLKFRNLVAEFKIGLGDPADTGLLFAIVAPATTLFGSSRLHQFRFEPSFNDEAVLQGYSQGTVSLRPISLAPPLMKFIFSLAALRIVRTLIKSKWKRKK